MNEKNRLLRKIDPPHIIAYTLTIGVPIVAGVCYLAMTSFNGLRITQAIGFILPALNVIGIAFFVYSMYLFGAKKMNILQLIASILADWAAIGSVIASFTIAKSYITEMSVIVGCGGSLIAAFVVYSICAISNWP
jgi:hypothetical protein